MTEASHGSALDRFLRLFTVVRAGEGWKAILMAVNIFLILTAYYVLKPVREALILSEGGAEIKSYISAGQVFLLAFIVPLYGRLVAIWPRRRLINVVTAFFAVCLVVFYLLAQIQVPLGIVFFIWIGIFNLMIVAQFWSFANDIYNKDQGERLFPIVGFGASLGAVLGAVIAGLLIEPLGVYQLMLVAAALLIVEVTITNYIESKEPQNDHSDLTPKPQSEPQNNEPVKEKPKGGSFALVFKTRYLLLMGFMLLFLNWVNTTGEFMLGKLVEDTAREAVALGQAGGLSVGQFIGKFYSDFFGVVNIVGVLIQLFIVSRVVKFLGVHVAVLILPLISLGAYGLLAFVPILGVVRWAKTAENSTDYSLNNTVRNMLFLPCTREQKYSAKQAIDSFFWRAGDVLSALLIFVGTTYFAWHVSSFAVFNIGLVAVWLVIAWTIGRRYKHLVESGETPT